MKNKEIDALDIKITPIGKWCDDNGNKIEYSVIYSPPDISRHNIFYKICYYIFNFDLLEWRLK